MREQKLLWSLLALNILFAAGCVVFLSCAQSKVRPLVAGGINAARGDARPTNMAQAVTCNWSNVDSEDYAAYLGRLRAAGCPEENIRRVVLLDIEERCAHKRLEEAISFDFQWWREDPLQIAPAYLQERARALAEERQMLIEKYLGHDFYKSMPEPTPVPGDIQLTGTVLGSLPVETQEKVQAICNRSIEQMDSAIWSQVRQGEVVNNIALAKIREQARRELRQILTPAQMEEFLLRFSRNAQELRSDLRAVDPTPGEFRRIFRSIDPLAQSMQLKYGDMEALGSKEQGRYLGEREAAIREALTPVRFQSYKLSKARPAAAKAITAAKP